MSAPITAPSVITHVRPAHCLLLPLLRHLLARFSDNHLSINTKHVPPLRQPPPMVQRRPSATHDNAGASSSGSPTGLEDQIRLLTTAEKDLGGKQWLPRSSKSHPPVDWD